MYNLFRKLRVLSEMAGDSITRCTAAYSMKACDLYVEATPPTSASYVVTLPPASQALQGQIYVITTPTNDTGTVSVAPKGGDTIVVSGATGIAVASATATNAMTTTGDRVALVPTPGGTWILVVDVTT